MHYSKSIRSIISHHFSFFILLSSLFFLACQPSNKEAPKYDEKDQEIVQQIFDEALENGEAYENLRKLCKDIGGRLSGSPQAAQAVEFTKKTMEEMGADNVFLQEVMVPHWVRGKKEQAEIRISGENTSVPVCALGGSVGTQAGGQQAGIIEVKDFETLAQLGREKVEGNWVFFNRSMRARVIQTFRAYGGAVNQRSQGAVEAAKYGGIGAIVRSMTQIVDDNPHTGAMRYDDETPRVPSAAISTKAAETLSKLLAEGKDVEFLSRHELRDTPRYAFT